MPLTQPSHISSKPKGEMRWIGRKLHRLRPSLSIRRHTVTTLLGRSRAHQGIEFVSSPPTPQATQFGVLHERHQIGLGFYGSDNSTFLTNSVSNEYWSAGLQATTYPPKKANS